MKREANTITISYHNKNTGQTMAATYDISAPNKAGACASELTLDWQDAEGKKINLGDFIEDPYGLAAKFTKILMGVSDENGGTRFYEDEDEDREAEG